MELSKSAATAVSGSGLSTSGSDDSESSNGNKYLSRTSYRRAAGAGYVLAMGVCGIVLIALASSLKDIAKLLDRTSIEVCLHSKTRDITLTRLRVHKHDMFCFVRSSNIL